MGLVMPRAYLTHDEVRARLSNVRESWLRARRLLQAEHGERWHQHGEKLERYESKGRELTALLPRCPDWWTLPCECRACREDEL